MAYGRIAYTTNSNTQLQIKYSSKQRPIIRVVGIIFINQINMFCLCGRGGYWGLPLFIIKNRQNRRVRYQFIEIFWLNPYEK